MRIRIFHASEIRHFLPTILKCLDDKLLNFKTDEARIEFRLPFMPLHDRKLIGSVIR
jgi:hypothetical protein